LDALLRPIALEAGVVDEKLLHAAIRETARLLRRFRAHSLWTELNAAQRWHELPFSVKEDERPQNGKIDLLYLRSGEWGIAEFKSDRLDSGTNLLDHIREEGYDDQVLRYMRAVRSLLSVEVQALLVFLNISNDVEVIPVPEEGRPRRSDPTASLGRSRPAPLAHHGG
jgi:ATP-dependent exoDNAse (exonuclease V) beta subunit